MSKRIQRSLFSLFAALILISVGCVGEAPKRESPATHPLGPVFLCHGAWPDNAWLWVNDLADALQARGIEAAPVPYFSLFGIGTGAPAERVASFWRELETLHRGSRCRAPLRSVGVGYSSGTDVLTQAANLGVPFERMYFAGSPLPAWSSDVRRALEERTIERLINYYSPIDGLMWITGGAGMFGYHAGGSGQVRVENRIHGWLHVTPLWNRTYAQEALVDELVKAVKKEARRHTCYQDPRYLAAYDAAKDRLRTDWEDRPPAKRVGGERERVGP